MTGNRPDGDDQAADQAAKELAGPVASGTIARYVRD
jgi:hypothetical protein